MKLRHIGAHAKEKEHLTHAKSRGVANTRALSQPPTNVQERQHGEDGGQGKVITSATAVRLLPELEHGGRSCHCDCKRKDTQAGGRALCHTYFWKQNHMHSICVPGYIYTHVLI